MEKKILMIEENSYISNKFKQFFGASYTVTSCHNGLQGLIKAIEWKPQVVIINHSLLNVKSIELCRQIHQQLSTIIIVVGSSLSEEEIVEFYRAGADDVHVGPISFPVISCKMSVLLNLETLKKNELAGEVHRFGNLVMCKKDYKIIYENRELNLTKKEFSIIWNLAKNQNAVVTREELLKYVWSSSRMADDRMIDTHLNRIRKKLKQHQINLNIKTVWGIGYRLQSDDFLEMRMA